MSRNKVINEAIAEAKAVREAALENAKSMIVDAFTPQLKEKVNKQLDEGVVEEGDQPAGYDSGHPSQHGEDMLSKGDGSAVFEDDSTVEGEDVAENEDVAEDVDEDVFEIALGEGEHEDEEEDEEGKEDMDEMPEMSMKEMPESDNVAEQVEAYVKNLEEENMAYKKAVKQLQKEFNEVNLFNAKLIYANKVLRTPGLTKNQKYGVVEQFDNAGTIGEVKLIFNSLTEGVKIGSAANAKPQARKSSANVKPASANGNIVNEEFGRMQELSGLLKD